jgi:hypothetical protein
MSFVMLRKLFLFGAVFFAGIIAGGQYVVSWDYHPMAMFPSFYTEKMQHAIRVIGTPLFAAQITTAVFSIVSAILFRRSQRILYLTLGAAGCCLTGVLLTYFGAIPILDQIAIWNIAAPPTNWHDLAMRWWTVHIIRFSIQVVAFILLLTALYRSSRET